MTLDEDFTELLLDSSLALRMTDEELLDFAELLLELDEGLDSSLALRMTDEELLDSAELLLGTLDEEVFAFSLLDEVSSAGSVTLPLLEDDSTPGSSFGPADADELSSHPTTANAIISMDPIAALRLPPWWPCALGNKLPSAVRQDDRSRNFFINASKRCLSKENVIYFHPKKAKQAQSINTKAARTSRTAKILGVIATFRI